MNARQLVEKYGNNGLIKLIVNDVSNNFSLEEMLKLSDKFRFPGDYKMYIIDENKNVQEVFDR